MGDGTDIMFVDSAAGIGCPVIASVTGSDYAVIVTEPTPSGFSDMKKAFEVVNHFNIPCGIVINKYDINEKHTEVIEEFARGSKLKIIAKIPFDKKFAQALTQMTPIIEYEKSYVKLFEDLKCFVVKAIKDTG